MSHSNISLFVPHAGCPHQCSFCNQKTISGSSEILTPEKVKCVLSDAVGHGNDPAQTEIAFFGGSFTAIERCYMVSLLEAAKPFVDRGFFSGIRISTRPDAIDSEVLDILKAYGVTAIELGAQSMDDGVLLANHRGHTKRHIQDASVLIKKQGFSLGLQMMTGLYTDTPEKAMKTCEEIIKLRPDTVRIYPTIVLEGTELFNLLRNGGYSPQSTEEAVELCSQLLERFNEENIRVIRLGLHSGGNVEEGYAAGPYHPAFGELCESAIYLRKAKKLLSEKYPVNNGNLCSLSAKPKATVFVNPKEISKMTGQKSSNKIKLYHDGWDIAVKGMNTLKKYEIIID
ncbi:MAG: radical SAM protein [Ruminococcaceae bacterium]|nr:radical SAM protein [Oscillospiraceae bacterium]